MSSFAETTETLIEMAMALTSQDWNNLSLGDDPMTRATSDKNLIIERLTALLAIRCVAVVARQQQHESKYRISCNFVNLSTSNICQQFMEKSAIWPTEFGLDAIDELREFVRRMIKGYKEVPYHNKEHAFHVVLSVNKLIDMMISGQNIIGKDKKTQPPPPTYVTFGLRHDPLALLSLMFSALIHDVEHQGIPNRQLAAEDDRLAILYNDQSMAENWSLYVAFSEWLQDQFKTLRKTLLPLDDDYRRFRKIVVDLVLSTDIASPERTQVNKSKWKEAFGDPFETIERKMQRGLSNQQNLSRRMSLTGRQITAKRNSLLSTVSAVSFAAGTAEMGEADMGEERDDDSLSVTPEHSDNEEDHNSHSASNPNEYHTPGKVIPYINVDKEAAGGALKHSNSSSRPKLMPTPSGNSELLRGGVSSLRHKFERRLSAASVCTTNTAKYRQRLGILRTVDLSGETIETFNRKGSMSVSASNSAIPPRGGIHQRNSLHTVPVCDNAAKRRSRYGTQEEEQLHLSPGARTNYSCEKSTAANSNDTISASSLPNPINDYEADEPDELKASVVMDVIMTAADVAHNLQGWDHMVKWSNRLYLELRRAFVAKRGIDPADRWYENQIGFLESYLLPMARRLEDTGVFGDQVGQIFAATVESNRDKWLTHGYEITHKAIDEGNERYPVKPKTET